MIGIGVAPKIKDGIVPPPRLAVPRAVAAAAVAVADCANAERQRWVLWLPVLLGTGIALYFMLKVEPPPWLGAALLGAAGLAGALASRLASGYGRPLRLLAVAAAVTAAGFTAAQLRTAVVAEPVLAKRVGPLTVSGRIRDIEPFPDGVRVELADLVLPASVRPQPTVVRLRLRGEQPPLRPGDRIRLRAILSPPPPPTTPGGFDFQRHAFFAGLGAVGFSVGRAERITGGETAAGDPREWFGQLRHAVAREVRAVLPGADGAVVIALLIGEQRALPEPVMAAIRDSGLAHLLSISGLHISLVAGFLMIVLRSGFALVPRLALRYPIKKWAAAGSVVGAGFYTLLAGAPVPAQRAFLMVAIVLLAILADRRTTPMRLVAAAAVVICLLMPEALLGPSFQMSFAAVIGLIALYEEQQRRYRPGSGQRSLLRRPLIYVAGLAATSLVATIATAPFVLYHFNRLALYGLAANLVAVPVTGLWIMPFAVLALVLMPFGLAEAALVPMSWGVQVVLWVARTVAAWPGAVGSLAPLPAGGLAAFAVGGLWLAIWQTRWRWCGLLPIAVGVAALVLSRPPDVLVDGRAKLLAVRTADGRLALSSATAAPLDRESWFRLAGGGGVQLFPSAGASDDGSLRCDALGCVLSRDGLRVAIARTGEALADDCRKADALVSVVPVRGGCAHPRVVVDRFALARDGGHALWIERTGIRADSVNRRRGARPWVPKPAGRGDSPAAGANAGADAGAGAGAGLMAD